MDPRLRVRMPLSKKSNTSTTWLSKNDIDELGWHLNLICVPASNN